jgi:serine/threonine protein kinase
MSLTPSILFDNRYRLVALKGRGSFGEVWHAHDIQTEMDVAVKVYIALDDRGVDEFVSEYRNAFGLNHPNLLHAYQFDLCDNRPYLVMPYCPNSAVELVGRADEMTMWRLVRDVAFGLSYLHGKGIVHRDIKPDNILMDKDGDFVVTDFGISTKMRSTLQRNSLRNSGQVTKGSISYMAPEMFSAQADAVYASDIWALGATLYEMVFGELPLMGQGGGTLLNNAKVEFPKTAYSKKLVDTIKECLAKEPWDRPRAEQLAERAKSEFEVGTNNNQLGSKQKNILGILWQNWKEKSSPIKFKKAWPWMVLAVVVATVLFAFSEPINHGDHVVSWLSAPAFIILIVDFLVFLYWFFVLDNYGSLSFTKLFLWMIIVGFVCVCTILFVLFVLPNPEDKSLDLLEYDEAVAFWESGKSFKWRLCFHGAAIIIVFNFIMILFSLSYLIVTRLILRLKRINKSSPMVYMTDEMSALDNKSSQEIEGVTKEKGFFSTIRKAKQ